MNFKKNLIFILALLNVNINTHVNASPVNETAIKNNVTMNSGSILQIPDGFQMQKLDQENKSVKLESLEKDMKIFLIESKENDLKQAIEDAWKSVAPFLTRKFDLKTIDSTGLIHVHGVLATNFKYKIINLIMKPSFKQLLKGKSMRFGHFYY
ncbi:MAG: hypothetical protein Q8S31_03905 [Alphaproteobacteria bacterium]|nr:hypothetical protein [Alphaproteobacteria bacterium]